MTITLSRLLGTASNQKKSKSSFLKIAIHHGLSVLGVAVCEKPDGRFSAKPVEVVIWLP